MKQRKKRLGVLLIVAVLLMGLMGYFYYHDFPYNNAKIASNTITTEEKTTETTAKTDSQATTEQRQELPDDYVWDTERLGEPPQIVYDFAENQERFDYIVEKVDSVVGKGDGFSTGLKYKGIYYNSKYEGIEDKLPSKFEKKAKYIFDNTPFYKLSKEVGGDWIMYYNQEEDRDRFIFIMSYIPGMTDEQAY